MHIANFNISNNDNTDSKGTNMRTDVNVMDKSNFISNFRQCLICIKRRKGSTISPQSSFFEKFAR